MRDAALTAGVPVSMLVAPGFGHGAVGDVVNAATAQWVAEMLLSNAACVRVQTPPVPKHVRAGCDAEFSIAVSGSPAPVLQWRRNGTPISTAANPSAATATLTLSDVTALDGGVYDCVASNICGTVVSNPASLTVSAGGPSDVAGPNQAIGSDGTLTADDIIVFLAWFFASDLRADSAGPNQSTTPDSQFTADDIIVFLGQYFAGC